MPKGSCLCGSIEIETKGDALSTVACSCSSCQRCSASVFTINKVFAKDSVNVIKGLEHLTKFKEIGYSGHDVHRYFCDTCGNAIYTQIADGTYFVKAPVFEGALQIEPQGHLFIGNLPVWADGVKSGDRKEAQ